MRLLCVSHPCVASPNQELFARIASQRGWDVTILLPDRWRNEYGELKAERWPAFQGELLPTRVIGVGRIPLHVYAARLRTIVRRVRPDAIYAHNEPYALSTFQAARAAGRIPFGFYSAQNVSKAYPWPISATERYVHRRAVFAFPVSEAVLDVLSGKGYEGRAEILPLWVDPYAYGSQGLPSERPPTLGFVGRLTPEKGLDVLLDALARLPSDVRAVVAGAGPAEPELRRRADALGLAGRVSWLGFVEHERMPGVYGQLDLLVVPSRTTAGWKEQFGRVVIEALAARVPVVAADSGELSRLLSSTEGGWLFPEGDVAALAGTLRRLLASPGELDQAARVGRAAVERRFGVAVVADHFATVVEEIVGASRSGASGASRTLELVR